jgi:hypothetical protein
MRDSAALWLVSEVKRELPRLGYQLKRGLSVLKNTFQRYNWKRVVGANAELWRLI